ncbi:PREDICTED: uncharacterized protein LOC105448982 [Wasmannia auropunctata]|uniref:uncharacterized protein LOC105448982 n=1 Tax=Wasmannia auropunctata TaxID=64793 RepID=UPI0005EF9980|nr:PREDICTED: uncharacterized protein LOC105448982 [Wasmannia auropunctata]
MKLTLFTILALCIIAVCKSAEEEYDYEEEAAAPVTPAPTKPANRLGGLLSSRGRVNVPNVGKKKAQAQSTTSKPVEQAPEEDVVEDEDALDENQEHEAPTTTTESAKKLRNNGGVRPFRSNEDLLAALKRRRAQTGPSSHSRETATTHSAVEHTTAKSKASTSNRSKASAGNEARTSGRGRFGGRGKIVQEEVEETQREEVQVKPKASSYRRRS